MVHVRLTRKFAEEIDGVDLSAYTVGELLRLPWHAAALLLAEGWAELIERRQQPREYQRRITDSEEAVA